jgi:GAF domain-containing protein
LPLVTARGVGGFITISRPTAHIWADEDLRLGLAIATQSAAAIENARLFNTLQQHNRHIQALNADEATEPACRSASGSIQDRCRRSRA